MSKTFNYLTLVACTLGTMAISTSAYSAGDAHGAEAHAKPEAGKISLIDAKKPLVDISNPIKNQAEQRQPTGATQAINTIPVPKSSPAVQPMKAPAGAQPESNGYSRPNLGLSPYYVNPYDSGLKAGLANGGGDGHATKKVAKKRHHVAKKSHGGSGIKTSSVERMDGQIRYLNQRQNNLEADVKDVKSRQNALESKYAIEHAYSIRHDQ